jgi:hypothetical protein
MVLRLGTFKMPAVAMETAKALNLTSSFCLYYVYSRASLLCYPTMCYNKLVSKARKKWFQLSAIIYNTSNGDVRRLYY